MRDDGRGQAVGRHFEGEGELLSRELRVVVKQDTSSSDELSVVSGAGRRQSELFIVVIAIVSHNRGSSVSSNQGLNSMECVSPASTVAEVSVAVASIADRRR